MLAVYRILTFLADLVLPPLGRIAGGKLRELVKGRYASIPLTSLAKTSKRYWFHCASLGEFEQARPLMERVKEEGGSVVLTFFSPSGYRMRYDYALADKVMYLPSDTPRNANRLIDYLQPDVAVFIKYELWYFHLAELMKRRIPVYLVSAVFRESQFLFGPFGKWLYKLLPGFAGIFVQDANSFDILEKKGLKNIELNGDTRYDRVKHNALRARENLRIAAFKGNARLLILGSSWQAEEELLDRLLQMEEWKDLKILIAPHETGEERIREIEKRFARLRTVRFTGSGEVKDADIMILNTVGHLASSYCYADVAFVGGAFGKGLHNILEPLAFGVPVIFGPETSKHPEAALAEESRVALRISDADGLGRALHAWVYEEESDVIRARCIDFINWNAGATERVLKTIL